MRKNLVRAGSAVLAAAMLTGLTACGGSGGSSTTATMKAGAASSSAATTMAAASKTAAAKNNGETITLNLWGGIPGEYGYDEMVENFNEEFKDKGIQVQYTRYKNDSDGNLQLDTYLSSGGSIDLYMGYGGISRLKTRVEAGTALDMTDYLKARNFDPVAELGTTNVTGYAIDGKYYALPTKYENKCWMVVNEDLFKEAGIELPLKGWTYEEFREDAKKLTKGTGQDKVWGMYWNMNSGMSSSLDFLGSMLKEHKLYADDEGTKTNLDNDLWKKGLQLVKDTYDDGTAMDYETETADNVTFDQVFLAGKAAMSAGIYNLRIINDLDTYPHDFTTAIVPFPVPDSSYMNEFDYSFKPGAGDLICVNPKSEHIEEAMDFVLWYIKGGMAPLAASGRIPLWKGFDADLVTKSLCAKEGVFDTDSVKAYMAVDGTKAITTISTKNDSKINSVITEEEQAFFLGQEDVDTCCSNMKTRADEILAGE
ncbi:MAG: extracellular solute-binding protein [Lachnospiraceae bacterium]|nr:extracellular solute-binding protein [Lachnospiraceae bacterium]